MEVYFGMLFILKTTWKAGKLQILCCSAEGGRQPATAWLRLSDSTWVRRHISVEANP